MTANQKRKLNKSIFIKYLQDVVPSIAIREVSPSATVDVARSRRLQSIEPAINQQEIQQFNTRIKQQYITQS